MKRMKKIRVSRLGEQCPNITIWYTDVSSRKVFHRTGRMWIKTHLGYKQLSHSMRSGHCFPGCSEPACSSCLDPSPAHWLILPIPQVRVGEESCPSLILINKVNGSCTAGMEQHVIYGMLYVASYFMRWNKQCQRYNVPEFEIWA